ncbi:hypothetical protein PENTCL1PPCAC_8689, partial [Pristionchus entomophagus]
TGLHELLGHGSGKLFERKADGTFNFDKENTMDILTGGKVASWFEPGQIFTSVFRKLAGPIEECRAFAVACVLGCDEDILRKMGHDAVCGQRVKFVAWLKMISGGICGFSNYDVIKK